MKPAHRVVRPLRRARAAARTGLKARTSTRATARVAPTRPPRAGPPPAPARQRPSARARRARALAVARRPNSVKREAVARATGVGASGGAMSLSLFLAAPIAETSVMAPSGAAHGRHPPPRIPTAAARRDDADPSPWATWAQLRGPRVCGARAPCLHWRPKARKGFDMREVKERRASRELGRAPAAVARAQGEHGGGPDTRRGRARREGLKLQEEARRPRRAAEKELCATKEQLPPRGGARGAGVRAAGRERRWRPTRREARSKSDFERPRGGPRGEERLSGGNLRRRHRESAGLTRHALRPEGGPRVPESAGARDGGARATARTASPRTVLSARRSRRRSALRWTRWRRSAPKRLRRDREEKRARTRRDREAHRAEQDFERHRGADQRRGVRCALIALGARWRRAMAFALESRGARAGPRARALRGCRAAWRAR